jgi:hypothetical protein
MLYDVLGMCMPRIGGVGLGLDALSARLSNLDLLHVPGMEFKGFGSSVGYGHYGLGFQA